MSAPHLAKSLNGFQLWGMCVGHVISGEYFGWSYGWASAGTLGFLAVTAFVAGMYGALMFSFTELTTAIHRASCHFGALRTNCARSNGGGTQLRSRRARCKC
jgi:ethanolamine permease